MEEVLYLPLLFDICEWLGDWSMNLRGVSKRLRDSISLDTKTIEVVTEIYHDSIVAHRYANLLINNLSIVDVKIRYRGNARRHLICNYNNNNHGVLTKIKEYCPIMELQNASGKMFRLIYEKDCAKNITVSLGHVRLIHVRKEEDLRIKHLTIKNNGSLHLIVYYIYEKVVVRGIDVECDGMGLYIHDYFTCYTPFMRTVLIKSITLRIHEREGYRRFSKMSMPYGQYGIVHIKYSKNVRELSSEITEYTIFMSSWIHVISVIAFPGTCGKEFAITTSRGTILV